jgi:transposase
MDEIGILPGYRSNLVHDGWWSYDYYTSCRHGLCGAHFLRELIFCAELSEEQKSWAAPLKALLLEIKFKVEQVRESASESLDSEKQEAFRHRYDELIEQGLKVDEPGASPVRPAAPEVAAQTSSCHKQARKLWLRLKRKKPEVLRFMTDFTVPFDHNQAERDLRMVKLQQKVSGCFRSEEGARQFCRIRGYISTMSKQGKGVLPVLEKACRGAPLSPTRRARLLNSYVRLPVTSVAPRSSCTVGFVRSSSLKGPATVPSTCVLLRSTSPRPRGSAPSHLAAKTCGPLGG